MAGRFVKLAEELHRQILNPLDRPWHTRSLDLNLVTQMNQAAIAELKGVTDPILEFEEQIDGNLRIDRFRIERPNVTVGINGNICQWKRDKNDVWVPTLIHSEPPQKIANVLMEWINYCGLVANLGTQIRTQIPKKYIAGLSHKDADIRELAFQLNEAAETNDSRSKRQIAAELFRNAPKGHRELKRLDQYERDQLKKSGRTDSSEEG